MATKSIQRSVKLLKEHGWRYEITERWNQWAKRRQDLFGFIDILCLDNNRTIAIQATAGNGDPAEHKRKFQENEYVVPWLCAGNELQMWSWRKIKKVRGGKAMVWDCKKTDVLLVAGELYFEERSKDKL